MNLDAKNFPLEGQCDCGKVRYRVETKPLFVHCCHCRWCQRESGSAYAINALIESDRVTSLGIETTKVQVPSESGGGQTIYRCPECFVAVWSNYGDPGDFVRMIRVGTLDNPDLCPPSIQSYVESKQPWVPLSKDLPVVNGFYKFDEMWPPESRERWAVVRVKLRDYEKKMKEAEEAEEKA